MTSPFSRRRFLAALAALPVIGRLVAKADDGQAMRVVVHFHDRITWTEHIVDAALVSLARVGLDWEWMTIMFTPAATQEVRGVVGLYVNVDNCTVWYCGIPDGVSFAAGEVVTLTFPVNSARMEKRMSDWNRNKIA